MSETGTCSMHNEPLIWEEGGEDKTTLHGRHYCPKCSESLMRALDDVEAGRLHNLADVMKELGESRFSRVRSWVASWIETLRIIPPFSRRRRELLAHLKEIDYYNSDEWHEVERPDVCWVNEDCIAGYHMDEIECRFPSWEHEEDSNE